MVASLRDGEPGGRPAIGAFHLYDVRWADLKSLDFRGTWGDWIEMEYTEQQKANVRQRFGIARGEANGLRLFGL